MATIFELSTFSKKFHKNDRFSEIFLKFGPQNTQKITFYCIFHPLFFRKLVALQRPILKLVVRHPPPFGGHPPISISDPNYMQFGYTFEYTQKILF